MSSPCLRLGSYSLTVFIFYIAWLTGLPVFAQGTGLTGSYYNNTSFTAPTVGVRVDAQINFNWGTSVPAGTGIATATNYSAIWSGQIQPPASGYYTFYLTADDTASIWIDGQLVASRTVSVSTSAKELRCALPLETGRRYAIRIEYRQFTSQAEVKLEWSTPQMLREVIPRACLYPTAVTPQRGGLMKEAWLNVPGTAINNLTASTAYTSNRPSYREVITRSESVLSSWAPNSGCRLSGYLAPAVSGAYRFAVSGGDAVSLELCTTAGVAIDAASYTKLATVTSATTPYDYTRQTGQVSSITVNLIAGQQYALRVLHKAGAGSSHFAVAWQPPGSSAWSVIPGDYLVPSGIDQSQPAESALFDRLSSGHPRLLASPERFAWLKTQYQTVSPQSPFGLQLKKVITKANQYKTGADLLFINHPRGAIYAGRDLQERVCILAMAWHMTGDNTYAQRAWTDLNNLAATNWSTWVSTDNGLGYAELTLGMAFGYDWLYPYWTAAQRTTLLTALTSQGLAFSARSFNTNAWWLTTHGNWNAVCNGANISGALAIGNDDPVNAAQARRVLRQSIDSLQAWQDRVTIDNGGNVEGYWLYQTDNFVKAMALLEGCLGSDFGISTQRGVAEQGLYPIQNTGPSGFSFNVADNQSGGEEGCTWEMFWLARRFNRPAYAVHKRNTIDYTYYTGYPLAVLWWDESGTKADLAAIPMNSQFRGSAPNPDKLSCGEVTVMRQNRDADSTFVGLKGNSSVGGHAIWDAGSIVLDALGKRWIHKIGGDRYVYNDFNFDRSTLYSDRAEGGNTLVFSPSTTGARGGAGQTNTASPVIFWSIRPDGDRATSVVDLRPAYNDPAKNNCISVRRGVRMINGKRNVIVQDEIKRTDVAATYWFMHVQTSLTTFSTATTTTEPAPGQADSTGYFVRTGDGTVPDGTTVYTKTQSIIKAGVKTTTVTPYKWNVVTQVDIAADGKSVLLTQGADRLWGRILGTNTYKFTLRDAKAFVLSPPQNRDNSDFKKLTIQTTTTPNVTTTISVYFHPLRHGEAIPSDAALPAVETLDAWMTYANEAPVASPGVAMGPVTGPVDIDLRTLVTDGDSLPAQLSFAVSGAVQGGVTLLADGYTARFIPANAIVAAPSFTYTVTDAASGKTASATVAVAVTPTESIWTGQPSVGATAMWSNSANWKNGVPTGGASAQLDLFPSTSLQARTYLLQQDIAGLTCHALTLAGAGPASGQSTVTLAGSSLKLIPNKSLAPELALTAKGPGLAYTLNTPIALSSGLAISGNGTAEFRLAGAITGTGPLTKTGTSFPVLAAANTYTGLTTINAGGLVIAASGSLGSTASGSGTIVNAGASLLLAQAVNYSAPEALTIAGAGADGQFGALGVADTSTMAFSGPITLAGDSTISAGQGNLTLRGTLTQTAAGYTLTTASDGVLQLNGALSGGGSLYITSSTGQGVVGLAGANSYTGATWVQTGALSVQNSTALGVTSAGTVVENGAALQFQGDIAIGGEPLMITGSGIASGGVLRNLSGNNTFGGLITLGGATQINSDTVGSMLTLSNPGRITGAGFGLTVGGAGDTMINGVIGTGSGTLTKGGTGTLTLTAANTYSGVNTITAGTLKLTNFNAAGANVGLNAIQTANTVAGAAVLDLRSDVTGTFGPASGYNIQMAAPEAKLAINVDNTSTGANQTLKIGNIDSNGSQNYSVDITGAHGYRLAVGSLNQGYNRSTTLNPTTAALIVTTSVILASNAGTQGLYLSGTHSGSRIDGIISGGSATTTLYKQNSSTWLLSGVNTYLGKTAITGGTLLLSGKGTLGASTNALVLGGGALDLGGTTRTVAALTLTAAASDDTLKNGSLTGTSYSISNGSGTAIISANLNGTANLTKSGAGPLILSGVNNYTGTTSITSTGVLNAQNGSALGTIAAGTTVASGGVLQLQGGIVVGNEPITLAGGGISSTGALRNISGNNTYGGLITMSAASRIHSDSGTLYLSNPGSITGDTFNLTLSGSGDILIASSIATTSGTLTKDGTGSLTLYGTNTYTGLTNIAGGTLKLGATNTLPVTTVVDLGSSTVATSTSFDLAGFNQTLAGIKRTSTNATQVSMLTNSSVMPATLTLNQTVTTTFSGRVTGNLSLVKVGTGTLNLSGAANNYTGNTTVTGGVLAIGSSALNASSWVMLDAGTLSLTTAQTITALRLNGVWKPAGTYSSANGLGRITGSGALIVTTGGPNSFSFWINSPSGLNAAQKAPSADPNGDGVNNLLAYALGAASPVATATGLLPTVAYSGGHLTLTLRRIPALTDITLTIQSADSPTGPWEIAATSLAGNAFTASPNYQASETGTGLTRQVVITDRCNLSDPAKPSRFMRLQANLP